MRSSATFRLTGQGWLASQARAFVVCALVFTVLAGSRTCLAMFAQPSAPAHCSRHGDRSQIPPKAPSEEPCNKAPELCCIATTPAITLTLGDHLWNTVSFARQETILPTRNAFLASPEFLRCPA